ncbi:MAG: hypothetical protein GF353_29560 [Candidatus Lokiarchaeota archaeon]|nr:hypothetical protein [Candidatus Lokiarchaeota archaeon]
MKTKTFLIGVALLALSCATQNKIINLPKAEREKITNRQFDHSYNKVFVSVMTVFENRGFTIRNTDKETGLIDTDYKSGHNIIWGDYKNKMNARIIKLDDNSCIVKLNPYIETKTFGSWEKVELRLKDKEVFDKYFNLIQEELNY